jgi:hypothetical protein
VKRRSAISHLPAARAGLTAALERASRRRVLQIRAYDARGHAHPIDPDREPGRRLLAAAEAMLSVAGDRPSPG